MIPGDDFRRLLRDEPSVLHGALRVIAPSIQGAAGRPARAREAGRAGHPLRRAGARAQQPGRGRAAQRRRTWPRRSRSSRTRVHEFVSSGVERDRGRDAGRAAAGGARRAPRRRRAGDAASTPPTARTRWSTLLDARGAGGLAAGAAAGRGRPRRGVARRLRRGPAGAGVRRGARVGGRLARARAAWRASSTTAPRASRRSSPRSRTTPTWTRRTTSPIDVHDGLESTLTMLGHKLKKGDVTVERDYDRDAARASPPTARSSTRCGPT